MGTNSNRGRASLVRNFLLLAGVILWYLGPSSRNKENQLARPKQVAKEDRETVTVTYTVRPHFAVTADNIPGVTGVGSTAREAVTNLRSEVRRRYPFHKFDIVERTDTRELMSAISWREPVYE